MRKGGGNGVEGEKVFDRTKELEVLEERVREGNHTLLTAQRRMGKTSLVRELQRRLKETENFHVVFVDLEGAKDQADAIAEIAIQTKSLRSAWDRIKGSFANLINAGGLIDEISFGDAKVKFRAGINAGNWQQKGDAIFAALARSDRPVMLAIDELPIFVNRMLKDEKGRITPAGRREADTFLSWLRKAGQCHRGRITLILSGSVSLEPLLEQAGLSAQVNIFSSYDLQPWSEETAVSCLAALADSYQVDLSLEVRRDMCRKLRCCIPHHVQMFFDRMHEYLRGATRKKALPDDVESVYQNEMLGGRGQGDLQHYEDRLKMILGEAKYDLALQLLTKAAVGGGIDAETIDRYRNQLSKLDAEHEESASAVDHVLHVLQHDGYLECKDNGYRFVSGLLEDWWRRRFGHRLVLVFDRSR